jgi:nitroreductase
MLQALAAITGTLSIKEHILTQLRWRYATKRFNSTRKIPEEEWEVLEASLVLSPSSFGMEPWRFLIVTDSATRARLIPAARNQLQVATAPHLVVFTAKQQVDLSDIDALVTRTARVRHISTGDLKELRNVVAGFVSSLSQTALREWAMRQVYIALGQFITTAAILGIDACPMEGFIPGQVDEILNLGKTGYSSVLLCPVGYRQTNDQHAQLAKVRRKAADVVMRID